MIANSLANGRRRSKSRNRLFKRDEKSGILKIQQLVVLAKSFKGNGSRATNAAIWTQVLTKEADRRALSNLHAVLGRSLGIGDRANSKQVATDDD